MTDAIYPAVQIREGNRLYRFTYTRASKRESLYCIDGVISHSGTKHCHPMRVSFYSSGLPSQCGMTLIHDLGATRMDWDSEDRIYPVEEALFRKVAIRAAGEVLQNTVLRATSWREVGNFKKLLPLDSYYTDFRGRPLGKIVATDTAENHRYRHLGMAQAGAVSYNRNSGNNIALYEMGVSRNQCDSLAPTVVLKQSQGLPEVVNGKVKHPKLMNFF